MCFYLEENSTFWFCWLVVAGLISKLIKIRFALFLYFGYNLFCIICWIYNCFFMAFVALRHKMHHPSTYSKIKAPRFPSSTQWLWSFCFCEVVLWSVHTNALLSRCWMAVVRLDGCPVNGRSDPNPSLGLSVSINLPGGPDGQSVAAPGLTWLAIVPSDKHPLCAVPLSLCVCSLTKVTSQDQTAFQSCWLVCLRCSFQNAFSLIYKHRQQLFCIYLS